jgi:hypothetical protein
MRRAHRLRLAGKLLVQARPGGVDAARESELDHRAVVGVQRPRFLRRGDRELLVREEVREKPSAEETRHVFIDADRNGSVCRRARSASRR